MSLRSSNESTVPISSTMPVNMRCWVDDDDEMIRVILVVMGDGTKECTSVIQAEHAKTASTNNMEFIIMMIMMTVAVAFYGRQAVCDLAATERGACRLLFIFVVVVVCCSRALSRRRSGQDKGQTPLRHRHSFFDLMDFSRAETKHHHDEGFIHPLFGPVLDLISRFLLPENADKEKNKSF